MNGARAAGRRVLVLREAASGAETARALAARGHVPLLLPLSRIEHLDPPLPEPRRFAAVLATSRHAVPWLERRRAPIGDVPALAVGPGTGAALHAAGWRVAAEGERGAGELAPRACAIAQAAGAPLLFAAGRVRLPETEAALRAANAPFALAEVYDTLERHPGRDEIEALGPADAALLLSVGQARGLVGLAARHPGIAALRPPLLLCLSERIAAALPPAARAHALAAPLPRLEILLDILGSGRHGTAEDLRCSGPGTP